MTDRTIIFTALDLATEKGTQETFYLIPQDRGWKISKTPPPKESKTKDSHGEHPA
jgi:hypothetical protein